MKVAVIGARGFVGAPVVSEAIARGLADYACAMVDELERPVHHRERFTVGY